MRAAEPSRGRGTQKHAPVSEPAAPRIPVLVVSDHRALGEALAMAIAADPGLAASTVLSATEAVEAARADGGSVVFLKLALPGTTGIDAIRRIRESGPAVRVIAVPQDDDELLWARAVDAGAIGFVSRRTSARDLPRMARRAHQGESLLLPEEEARLLRLLRRQRHQEATERQRANRLTPRQIEVLQLTAEGASLREMATRLGITQPTLRTHMQNILTRLGVHSKYEALTVAIRHGKVKAGF